MEKYKLTAKIREILDQPMSVFDDPDSFQRQYFSLLDSFSRLMLEETVDGNDYVYSYGGHTLAIVHINNMSHTYIELACFTELGSTYDTLKEAKNYPEYTPLMNVFLYLQRTRPAVVFDAYPTYILGYLVYLYGDEYIEKYMGNKRNSVHQV